MIVTEILHYYLHICLANHRAVKCCFHHSASTLLQHVLLLLRAATHHEVVFSLSLHCLQRAL